MTSNQAALESILKDSRPGRGEPPAELNDSRNYLVFDRIPGPRVSGDLTNSIGKDDGGRLTLDDPSVVLGIVVGPSDPVSTEFIEEELKGSDDKVVHDNSPYIPDWTAVSPAPTLAPAAEGRYLIRRKGKKVRPELVIHPDNRSPYIPNTYPYSIVGRLFVWHNAATPNWSGWGTASLLGARTILTASHVVPWNSPNWKALFVPGYYGGGSIHGAWASSWVTDVRGYRAHAQGDDIAVLRLNTPLGSSLGTFGFLTYDPAWEDQNIFTLPGYPWDKDSGNKPWVHLNFPIIDDDNDGAGLELEYRADTEGGQSGSPVYRWLNGAPWVVGTHSGSEDNPGEPRQNVAAGGRALTNLLHWARSNWP